MFVWTQFSASHFVCSAHTIGASHFLQHTGHTVSSESKVHIRIPLVMHVERKVFPLLVSSSKNKHCLLGVEEIFVRQLGNPIVHLFFDPRQGLDHEKTHLLHFQNNIHCPELGHPNPHQTCGNQCRERHGLLRVQFGIKLIFFVTLFQRQTKSAGSCPTDGTVGSGFFHVQLMTHAMYSSSSRMSRFFNRKAVHLCIHCTQSVSCQTRAHFIGRTSSGSSGKGVICSIRNHRGARGPCFGMTVMWTSSLVRRLALASLTDNRNFGIVAAGALLFFLPRLRTGFSGVSSRSAQSCSGSSVHSGQVLSEQNNRSSTTHSNSSLSISFAFFCRDFFPR